MPTLYWYILTRTHTHKKGSLEAIQTPSERCPPFARGEYDKDARKNKLTVAVKKKVIALPKPLQPAAVEIRVGRGETEEIKNEVTSQRESSTLCKTESLTCIAASYAGSRFSMSSLGKTGVRLLLLLH